MMRMWTSGVLIAATSLCAEPTLATDGPCQPHWDTTPGHPMTNGAIHAFTVHDGQLHAGGNTPGPGNWITRLTGDEWNLIGGSFRNPLGVDTVYALTEWQGHLVVGGNFETVDGRQVNHIALWNGESWQPVGGGVNGAVRALASVQGDLIAGGVFSEAGGAPAMRIARWNGEKWHALAEDFVGSIRALIEYNGDLVVAGDFSSVNSTTMENIALLDMDSGDWHPLKDGLPSTLSHAVTSLIVHDGDLYAGGNFREVDGAPGDRVARWDGAQWHPVGAGFQQVVYALESFQGDVFAGGWLIQSGDVPISGVARWDGETWSQTGEGLVGNVRALYAHNGLLYAEAEGMHTAEGRPINSTAKWDGESWQAAGTGTNGTVATLYADGDVLYAGGGFHYIGGVASNRAAYWDGSQWNALPDGLPHSLNNYEPFIQPTWVQSFTTHDGTLVAGLGTLTQSGTIPQPKEVVWQLIEDEDGPAWQPLGAMSIAHNGSDLLVHTLEVFEGELYAGGNFFFPFNNFMRWDGDGWAHVADINGQVRDMLVFDDELHLAGSFTSIDGVDTSRIARWDGQQWHPLGEGLTGIAPREMAILNGDLIVAGRIETAGGMAVNNIARWDGTQWHPLGEGVDGGSIWAIQTYAGNLYVSGTFDTAGGQPIDRIARWDGQQWHPITEPITLPEGIPTELTVYNGALSVAGNFQVVADEPANRIAKFVRPEPAVPGDLDCDGTVGIPDLLMLISAWGDCNDCDDCPADLTGDCAVGIADLLILISNWG